MDDIGQRRAALSPTKQALLLNRLRGVPGPAGHACGIPAGNSVVGPLAQAQQRFWFFHRWAPDVPLYHSWVALRLRGPLDTAGLERSLDDIVLRHEPLRTVFAAEDGEPVQRVCPAAHIAVPVEDLPDLGAARESMEECIGQPFDLGVGPLVRVRLYRLEAEDHVLLLVTHHIVFDGWSANVLVSEFCALYGGYVSGQPARLPDLPVRYLDFARWQAARPKPEDPQDSLGYWMEKLGQELPVLDLPLDRPRPTKPTFRGVTERRTLPGPLVAELRALSQREGATLFMVLLAAFNVLLSRYTGQDDLIVGSPTSGRRQVETEHLIGCFIDMLALRSDLSGNPTFRDVLAQVRRTCLEAYAHQDVSLERVVETLQLRREPNRTPVFQVIFNVENIPEASANVPGLSVEMIELDREMVVLDLSLEIIEAGAELGCLWEYNTELFERGTIERMAGHYRRLLDGIVANPEERIGTLPLLTDPERDLLLHGWNETAMEHPRDKCPHHLLEELAEAMPDGGAVVFGERRLTFAQLNGRANQLARRLRDLGVAPGDVVGLYLRQSIELLVGIMGVWKAGAAYVPLDTGHPLARTEAILHDAGVETVVTQGELAGGLGDYSGRTVRLDVDWEEVASHSEANLPLQVRPEDVAYVIYTSGSTGQPKGCLVQHAALSNHLYGMQRAIYVDQPGGSRQDTLNFPLTFDASVDPILRMLLGHCLHIVPEDIRADGRAMVEFLEERDADIVDTTPTQLELMAAAGLLEESGRRARIGLVSGEAVPDFLWRRLGGASHTVFYNTYGPTECAIYATSCRVTPDLPVNAIGRPLGNRRAYIVDRRMEPVPIGVAGEICLGGMGVGLGYLNCPESTAEAFMPDPFSPVVGARLYRTGDLGRYLPDGNIQFLGRTDRQVKVRGFRIELGEVEAALSSHPAVVRAVAVLREDRSGDPCLTGYVVPAPGALVTAGDIRGFLKGTLPEYMVPSAIVVVAAMPLTRAGKIDWRSLPPPGQTADEHSGGYEAPRSPAERVLADIWAGVLGRSRVGVNDNFFELGGHSLLAMRAVARAQTAFRVDLPLRSLFERPTVAGMAEHIAQVSSDADSVSATVPGASEEREDLEL